jgi:imidazole glycerol-phosphate synthase subunit HisH
MTRIGVVDCGISNVGSVCNAFAYLEIETKLVHGPADVAGCSHLVLPGDGTFPMGMRRLRESGLDHAVSEAVDEGKPLLGICLGMQLLAEEGEEFETTRGLGLTCGRVVLMRPDDPRLPLPQIGWNEVHFLRETRLSAGLNEWSPFYFMQSYAFSDPSASAVAGLTEYGGQVVAVIEQGHVFGVQFHPEKSQRAGLAVLRNFARVA